MTKLKTWLFGAVGAALLLASPVLAQPATGAAPSAHQMEVARELIEVSGAKRMYATAIGPMMNQMMNASVKSDDPDKARMSEAVQAAMRDSMNSFFPKLLDASADAYARTYSEEEMEGIIAFYKSPAGQAMLAKAPQLAQNIGQVMIPMLPQLKRDMINDLCDRISCTADKRKAMLGAAGF